jgi:hypothetical protein
MPLTLAEIARQRLINQHVTAPAPGSPQDAVSWLVAVQAQDYYASQWALGMRLQNVRIEQVEQAFEQGAILRTHLLRPTWHYVTPTDIRWLLALTAPRVHTVSGSRYRQLELDLSTLKHAQEVIALALQGGKQLKRSELGAALKAAGIIADGQRLTYIVMSAELDGVICSGARRGKQFTYALLEERAPHARRLERDEALAELSLRYYRSRGPATPHDFAKWSGLTVADARRGLEVVQSNLQYAEMDGQTYWFAEPAALPELAPPRAFLLSIYDEYISSYKDHRAIADPSLNVRLRAQADIPAYMVVIDGRMAGTCSRSLEKDSVTFSFQPFSPLSDADLHAITQAAQRFGEFLDLPASIIHPH